MELVSIIMPTYKNDGIALKRALYSLINQTYQNWELILIDDNSDPLYSSIILKIISNFDDDRIHYYKNTKNL